MQFIERNSFNVRSAVYHVKKDGSGVEFLVFPMIHVGSKDFFNIVSQRLAACDLILAEGVSSRKASMLTLSYRIVKKIKRMDLVTQGEGLETDSFRGRIITADLTGRAFDDRWSTLPLKLRAQLFVMIPIFILSLFFFGTRESIARTIATDDLPTPDEILTQDEDWEKFDTLVVDERDRNLIATISKVHDANENRKKLVGIVYGAVHMRSVMRFLLDKLKYRIAKAEWVTVFEL